MADETTDRENEEEEIEELESVEGSEEVEASGDVEDIEGEDGEEEVKEAEPEPEPEPQEQFAEVESKFDEKKDCAGLLYAPLAAELTYRKTRCYRFKFLGSSSGMRNFIRRILVDAVSQDVALDGKPVRGDCRFYLDYGMKKGVLDLEKEAIMKAYEEIVDPDFEILELELSTRVYVFGSGAPPKARPGAKEMTMGDLFVRDIVNPAIHRWSIHDERSIA